MTNDIFDPHAEFLTYKFNFLVESSNAEPPIDFYIILELMKDFDFQ